MTMGIIKIMVILLIDNQLCAGTLPMWKKGYQSTNVTARDMRFW